METTQPATAEDQTSPEAATPSANPLERSIDLSVSQDAINNEVNIQLKRIAKTAKVAGFRPGKVPMKMVAQMYGQQAQADAIGAAVDKAFHEAVREQSLRIVSRPQVEPKQSEANSGELLFTARFEVLPEFQIADITSSSLEKPVLEVGDAEVDKTIEALRKQRTTYSSAGRPAENGDRLLIDFTGRKDGIEFEGGKAENYAVVVGSGSLLPDFEAAMLGVSEGDEKVFDVNFPENYQSTELAGAKAEFTMKVKQVEKPELPPLDEAFAKDLGVASGNVEEMRNEVRNNLEREVHRRLEARLKEKAIDILLQLNPIDVPQSMVTAESQQMAENFAQQMQARNPQAQAPNLDSTLFRQQAERRVRTGLVVAELIKKNNLETTPEQVRAVVDDFASTFEDPKEVVRWYYSDKKNLADAEALAMEKNVVEWVVANAKVTDTPVSFDDLMGHNPA